MGSSCGSPLTHPALSRGLDDFFALLPGLGGCDSVLQPNLADCLLIFCFPLSQRGGARYLRGEARWKNMLLA